MAARGSKDPILSWIDSALAGLTNTIDDAKNTIENAATGRMTQAQLDAQTAQETADLQKASAGDLDYQDAYAIAHGDQTTIVGMNGGTAETYAKTTLLPAGAAGLVILAALAGVAFVVARKTELL